MATALEVTELARDLREELASGLLSPAQAKLYSQHTRLRYGQPPLTRWRQDEAARRLADAGRLIEAALIERQDQTGLWRDSVRRAAELLEWLDHPELNITDVPLRLLAAACYQLAGYPARAAGILATLGPESESEILAAFLRSDFVGLLERLVSYWTDRMPSNGHTADNGNGFHSTIANDVIRQTTNALGVLCAAMRWGDETRLKKAIKNLRTVAEFLAPTSDTFSWLLSDICASVAQELVDSSMRHHVIGLRESLSTDGHEALERYLRDNYLTGKSIAWASQVSGIERLRRSGSFALCTPTGSGKTTIAELAILQGLFSGDEVDDVSLAPIAVYLVPSRALAAEVESKLTRALGRASDRIVVTGLYGGTDWGPTDAWLTYEDRAVLICTYEKGEALLRFLGPLFLSRLALLIIDEAHSVQLSDDRNSLWTDDNRSLRLESLATRLFAALEGRDVRVIALSAVASGVETALASWVLGKGDGAAVTTRYRSTRQLVGRLECLSDNRFEIRYDLLDRAPLAFSDAGNAEYPYVPTPFPPVPKSTNIPSGPDKRLRPYLLWAAIHLSVDETGRRRAVLISVTQNVGGYAEDFLQLLERQWLWAEMPTFFEVPVDGARSELWQHCLDATEDYFGRDSREYRLLNHGVAIHHGRMPGLLARLLVEVIDAGIVSIVLATSTLSEGVNLPFETVLVPNLYRRGTEEVGLREFANLVGRAGRPGVATEGRSLVLLPPEPPERDRSVEAWSARRTRNTYFGLVKGLQEERGEQNQAASPLGELLAGIRDLWTEQFGPDLASFERWLEQTAPLSKQPDDGSAAAATALDVLDGVLLPALVEMEILKGTKLSPTDAETGLRSVWNHSFARYAAETESSLEKYFVTRGRALVQDIYPESGARRRLYRTGLAPRPGTEMLATYETLLEYLRSGADYAIWPDEERFRFIEGTVDLLRAISKFAVNEKVRKNSSTTWRQILRWWLDPTNSDLRPSATQVSAWQDFVNQNFVYRFNWGLGSICSLAIDQAHQGQLQPINLEDWPETGLPWIVFWMKELLTWGTLDPVASFILARRWKYTRTDARELAGAYYAEHSDDDPNEILNAAKVRAWLIKLSRQTSARTVQAQETIPVRLLRDFSHSALKEFRVLPAPVGTSLQWLDIAGFSLAESELPTNWPQANIHAFDYVLDAGSRPHVLATPYL